MEESLIDGVEDIEYEADFATIYTQPAMLAEVRDALRARGARISDAYLGMRAKTKLELAGERADGRAELPRSARGARRRRARLQQPRFDRGIAGGARLSSLRGEVLRRDWIFPLVLAIFVAIVVWFGRQIYDFLIPSSATVTIPSFVGQTLPDANAEIARLKLSSAVVDHTTSDRYPKDVVIMQRPEAGDVVREGRQISFVISDGILARLMPDLRYQSMREVQLDLSRERLSLGKVSYAKSDVIPEGHVISQIAKPAGQRPRRRRRLVGREPGRKGRPSRAGFRGAHDRPGADAGGDLGRQARPDRLDAAGPGRSAARHGRAAISGP